MAERIQRRRTKGWRMPEGAVYVGRPSILGDYGMDVECDHPPHPKPTRRRRLRRWIARRWDRRPRVHLGPCDHEGCE